MNIHVLEHDRADGPGAIVDWAQARGHTLVRTALHAGEPLPPLDVVNMLVVMGGPMNVYQHRDYSWLPAEKCFLAAAIDARKPVLGICLGAQLLADVLGGKVFQNTEKEIGWFPVRIIDRAPPFTAFPETFETMHWHGDTFTLPPGARRVAESEACANQAFVFGDRVVGLQFHPEMGPFDAAEMSEAFPAELSGGARYVQTREQLLATPTDLPVVRASLFALMNELAGGG